MGRVSQGNLNWNSKWNCVVHGSQKPQQSKWNSSEFIKFQISHPHNLSFTSANKKKCVEQRVTRVEWKSWKKNVKNTANMLRGKLKAETWAGSRLEWILWKNEKVKTNREISPRQLSCVLCARKQCGGSRHREIIFFFRMFEMENWKYDKMLSSV